MAREEPKPFSMKDLFIDVKLEACANGTTFDFLGRKLFSSEFFRKDTGFGITSIDVEVNTSLQPIVSITFKDLYGQTIFGGQGRNKDIDSQSIDYSVIFDWPPPKFLFSFKGYLGSPVSWMLNLKKTSTSFNSSDGSYEIKCEFVPNQWGFFADLPMLFLLAAKSLRKEQLGSSPSLEDRLNVTSIFDLVKIGKQVEIKTQDTTKEFDGLVKQLGSLKSNLAGSLSSSKIIEFGEKISGVVNNIQIKDFIPITIPNISDLDSTVGSEEKISLRLGDPTKLVKLNTYLILKLKFNGVESLATDYASVDQTVDKYSIAKNVAIGKINTNLRLIEDEIKRRVFSTSEKKLEQITIGAIFNQLAKDAAYIMGRILDAGIDGYEKNTGIRDANIKNLIGNSFPMIIKEGNELPATNLNSGLVLGVDENEMDFVRKFINAISEGIANDLLKDSDSVSEDNTLKSRISNLEMTKGNPYKPYYQDIATNILVRGGIAGFITRSNDPNRPGDYGNSTSFDNDSAGSMIELATGEIKNIDDKILGSLPDVDALLLKRFCRFFIRFYDSSGVNILDKDGKKAGLFTSVSDAAEYPVLMSEEPEVFLTFAKLFNGLRKPTSFQTIDEFIDVSEYETDPIIVDAQHPLSFVDTTTYSAQKILNNGIGYTVTKSTADRYWYVVFEDDDNVKAQEVNSSKSDAEYRDEEKDDPKNMFFTAEKPLGYIPINTMYEQDDAGVVTTTKLGRVDTLEARVTSYEVVDYNKLKHPESSFYDVSSSSGFENYLWQKKIYETKEAAITAGEDLSKVAIAGTFGYTIFSNFDKDTSGDNGSVFDMFLTETRSRNQRVFIRKVCELVLSSLNRIEEERNQVIGSVLGKAGEQEAALYKQMHTLFHQWQALSYDGKGGCGTNVGPGQNITKKLEDKYSGEVSKKQHVDIISDTDLNSIPDGAFIYEFPLQRINGIPAGKKPIKVRDSIINIEPLYKPNGETSVLNIIQQICTKNNFLFVPIPGNASYLNVGDIYNPSPLYATPDLRNFFHVLFTPTPESRAKTKNGGDSLTLSENHRNYLTNSFVIKYGHPDNQIVSNIQVGTDDSKVTAESVVNLQRLVDNENQNKTVTTDCSTLPILEGRSYNASLDMLGNAQVYPMQFFYLENSPLFGGLYQVMKVKHSITPNDMKTSVEGVRMRFTPGAGYGSIAPITLQTFRDLKEVGGQVPFDKDEVGKIRDITGNTSSNGSGGTGSGGTGSGGTGSGGTGSGGTGGTGGADCTKTTYTNIVEEYECKINININV